MTELWEVCEVLEGRRRWAFWPGRWQELLPWLPANSIDHVITDAPYEAEAHANMVTKTTKRKGKKWVGKVSKAPLTFGRISTAERRAAAAEFGRVARGWVMTFCQLEALGKWKRALKRGGMDWKRSQLWVKPAPMPQLSADRPAQAAEGIATAWKPLSKAKGGFGEGSKWNGGGRAGVYIHQPPQRHRRHPNQKPIELMRELVSLFTWPDNVILDPWGGSGMTGLAALQLGRRVILCEADAEWQREARDVLSGGADLRSHKEQGNLF